MLITLVAPVHSYDSCKACPRPAAAGAVAPSQRDLSVPAKPRPAWAGMHTPDSHIQSPHWFPDPARICCCNAGYQQMSPGFAPGTPTNRSRGKRDDDPM